MPEIVAVWKDGSYGTTVWFHELSCGHIVTDRRRSKKPELPCVTCDQLSSLPLEEDIAVQVVDVDRSSEPGVTPDETARLLESEAHLRVRLAARLGVTVESIRFVEFAGSSPAAVVTLFPAQVEELLDRG